VKVSVKSMARVVAIALLCISTSVFAQQTWTVNFKDTDIQEVIKFIADATGKTIVVDPKVRGQVRVISDRPVNEEELYQLFLSVMDVQGFTAVESGNVVRIVPNRDARSLPVPTTFGDQGPDDTYVTQVLMLENISASKVLPTLRPLVPQHGHLSAYDPSNAIIVTDTRANILRLKEVIAQIDRSSVSETELVELRFARAEDVAQVISQLERGDREGGKSVMVVPDNRINGILVQGDQIQRMRIRELISRLDRPQARDSNVRVVYLEYAKAERVAQVLTGVLQNLSRGGNNADNASVQADEDTNALLITTSDDDIMQSLLTVIEGLDIRRAQVLVEAIIVEIEGSDGRELGVQWMYRDNKRGFGSSADGSGRMGAVGRGAFDDSDDGLLSLASTLSQTSGQMFGIGRLGERTDFLSILNMLQETSSTNILSTPNLLTTDNHTASISAGQNVPFATGSFTNTGGGTTPQNPFRTIERRDVGILLEVTPHINEGDSIVLNISQEVSSLSNIDSADGPITNQRKLQTQVLTADGETVVLGGMIQDDVQTSQQKVPFLGDIPLLGHLFRNQTNRTSKTNLLIFIRATVVRDDRTLEGATAEKYRAIREEQLRHRGRSGMLINRSTIPVLPEWEEQMRGHDVERIDPDAMPEDEE
jgi:general secretion pathway protein D